MGHNRPGWVVASPSRGGAVEGPGGHIVLVLALVAGAAVWVFTTSPGYALLALLCGLVLWEYGRRSRYRRHLRFVLPPGPRSRPSGRQPPPPARITPRASVTTRRPPWNRASAWQSSPRPPVPTRRQAPNRPRPANRSSTRPRP